MEYPILESTFLPFFSYSMMVCACALHVKPFFLPVDIQPILPCIKSRDVLRALWSRPRNRHSGVLCICSKQSRQMMHWSRFTLSRSAAFYPFPPLATNIEVFGSHEWICCSWGDAGGDVVVSSVCKLINTFCAFFVSCANRVESMVLSPPDIPFFFFKWFSGSLPTRYFVFFFFKRFCGSRNEQGLSTFCDRGLHCIDELVWWTTNNCNGVHASISTSSEFGGLV